MTTKTDGAPATADVLTKPVPALSTTSDLPVVTASVAPEKKADPVDPKAGETKQPDAKAGDTKAVDAGDKGDGKTPDAKTDDKDKNTIKERFSKVTAERRAAEDRANKEEAARKVAEEKFDTVASEVRQLKEMLSKVIPAQDEDPKPDRTKFDDPNKFDEALASWGQRQGEKKGRLEAEAEFTRKTDAEKQKAAEETQKVENDRVAKNWQERSQKFTEENPDFLEVIQNDQVQITPVMAQAMAYAETGPKLAYHLGKNPEVAAKIASLPPAMQIYELGKLEASLNVPPKTTKTPEPIAPLTTGRSAALTKSPADESMDEYAARRSAELRPPARK